MNPVLKKISFFLILSIGVYGIYAGVLFLLQNKMLYKTDPHVVTPQAIGLKGVQARWITAQDGTKLVIWAAQAKPDKPTILFFPGHSDTLAHHAARFCAFLGEGWGLRALSYRGYGGSEGEPSEKNIISDALLLYKKTIKEGITPQNLILYGDSLGTGVAVQIAAARPAAALILEAPYSSITEVAESRYLVPANLLLRDQYRSIDFIDKISMPLLWLHGKQDRTVPFRFGEKLFDRAHKPKQAAIFPEGGHDNLYEYGAFEKVRDFVEEYVDSKPNSTP